VIELVKGKNINGLWLTMNDCTAEDEEMLDEEYQFEVERQVLLSLFTKQEVLRRSSSSAPSSRSLRKSSNNKQLPKLEYVTGVLTVSITRGKGLDLLWKHSGLGMDYRTSLVPDGSEKQPIGGAMVSRTLPQLQQILIQRLKTMIFNTAANQDRNSQDKRQTLIKRMLVACRLWHRGYSFEERGSSSVGCSQESLVISKITSLWYFGSEFKCFCIRA
jgi:hypothetical protein